MSTNSRIVDVPPYGSPEWVQARNRGLGASEVAILTGDDRYRGEWDLAATKRGEAPDTVESWPMRMGHLMEPICLDWYDREHDCTIVRGETWSDNRWPHVSATLDGRYERIGVEAKWTNRWPADQVPRSILVQCYVQMGCADLSAVDIVRVSSRDAPEVVATIEADRDIIDPIMDLAEEWWQAYMIEGKPLPIDASRAASRYLARLDVPSDMEADATQAALVAQWLDAKRRLETAEHDQSLIANRIKESMAGSYALTGPGFRVSWKPQKAREKKDWEAIAIALAMHAHIDPVVINETVTAHTETGEGARPFRVTVEEETTP